MLRKLLSILCAAMCGVAAVSAQERRWEAEVYGGAVAATDVTDGKRTLPAAGAAIATSSPLFPSREVPSWFFGDGSSLLNAVNQEFQGTSRIAPLDPLFAAAGGARTGAVGVRVRRKVSRRSAMELSLDFGGSASLAPKDLASAVESARRSFGETVAELLRSGPFTSVAVDATAQTSGGSRRDVAATVAVNSDIGSLGRVTPYFTLGGGIVTGTGAVPSAELTGTYRFSILGQVPVDERDRVSIAFDRPLAVTGVLGGGLRRDVGERWTVRMDVRAFVGPDSSRIRVTAEPSAQRGTPAGFIESFTTPSIQFSNDPAIGRRSSLSAAPLNDVTVFTGGIRTRVVIAAAFSRRF